MIATPMRLLSFQLVALTTICTLVPTSTFAQATTAPEKPLSDEAVETEAELKTVGVVAFSSRDEVLSDLDFLGELGGRPGLSGVIQFFSGGALEVLDESRPVGIVLQTDGTSFMPLGCLPISDMDRVLEVAENFGLEPFDAGDGVYELEIQEKTVYMQKKGDWVFAAQKLESLSAAPADPGPMLTELVKSYDIAVNATVQNVPAMYRQLALNEMRKGMEDGLVQQEGESDEDFATRRKLAETQVDQISDMIEGLDEVTIGWAVDSKERQTFIDAKVTGIKDSDIALAMSVYKNSTSGVTAFHRPEAAMSLLTTGTTPPELLEKQKEQIEASVEMLRTQATKGIKESDELADDPEMQDALLAASDDLIEVYGDMLRSGKVELGGSLDVAGDGFDLIAAAYVTDPSKVESAFKKLAEGAKNKPDFPGVEWGYAEHAGVKLHGMNLPVPEKGQAREVLGETLRVIMGVGDKRVYLAVGPRGEESLKKAIDESATMTDKQIKPGEVIVSLGQVLKAAEKITSDQPKAASIIGTMLEAIEEAPEGTDQLIVTTEAIDNGVKIRYLIERGVLEAIGDMAAQAAAAAQQQQQQGPDGF